MVKRRFSYWPTLAVLVVVIAGPLALYMYQVRPTSGDIIVKDIAQLVTVLEKIDKDCDIVSFDYQKNPINFLNIKSFAGSEVASMNLVHPDKWQGPYMQDNPTMQGREYQVVRTQAGYFVTPGEGVKLPNGKVIGKDVMLDEAADIAMMMHDKNGLLYNNQSLAAPLNIRHAAYDEIISDEMV